ERVTGLHGSDDISCRFLTSLESLARPAQASPAWYFSLYPEAWTRCSYLRYADSVFLVPGPGLYPQSLASWGLFPVRGGLPASLVRWLRTRFAPDSGLAGCTSICVAKYGAYQCSRCLLLNAQSGMECQSGKIRARHSQIETGCPRSLLCFCT